MESQNLTVVSVVGIRPDFIRMSKIIQRFDKEFTHFVIHSGQHYDPLLSDVFFKGLNIRKPDMNLHIGGGDHVQQLANLTNLMPETLQWIEEEKQRKIDYVVFLGDSNTVLVSPVVKKAGYKVVHIEAGMRSRDRQMYEEINRVVCDHVSDIHFCYTHLYRQNLLNEGIPSGRIFCVGNTIVEVVRELLAEIVQYPPKGNFIAMDIHRRENYTSKHRLSRILEFAVNQSTHFQIPVKMVGYPSTIAHMKAFELSPEIEILPLMSYREFLQFQYDSLFIISDSGTAQEEPALFKRPVIVPRDSTERPESVAYFCSRMLRLNLPDSFSDISWYLTQLLKSPELIDSRWLGDGTTSLQIVEGLKRFHEAHQSW